MNRLLLASACLIVSCYGKNDAKKDVLNAGGVPPVQCVMVNGNQDSASSFVCVDYTAHVFHCDEDGCVMTGKVEK